MSEEIKRYPLYPLYPKNHPRQSEPLPPCVIPGKDGLLISDEALGKLPVLITTAAEYEAWLEKYRKRLKAALEANLGKASAGGSESPRGKLMPFKRPKKARKPEGA